MFTVMQRNGRRLSASAAHLTADLDYLWHKNVLGTTCFTGLDLLSMCQCDRTVCYQSVEFCSQQHSELLQADNRTLRSTSHRGRSKGWRTLRLYFIKCNSVNFFEERPCETVGCYTNLSNSSCWHHKNVMGCRTSSCLQWDSSDCYIHIHRWSHDQRS